MMKKQRMVLMTAVVLLLSGCGKNGFYDVAEIVEPSEQAKETKTFTFTVKGDFGAATFAGGTDVLPVVTGEGNGEQAARMSGYGGGNDVTAYLQAEGKDMTDLWVFDYVDGECVQQLHQVATDADFGKPQMSLAYGAHHIYFVASRGEGASVDADGHAITWSSVRDTFWQDYEVTVVSTSNGNRAVTLDRVATRLKITPTDAIPSTCASIEVTPERWYYGIDYISGQPVAAQQKAVAVQVPSSYIGTTGQVNVSVFGISGQSEWVTNVGVVAKDGAGAVIGNAQINGAPFRANRSTEYSGTLFGSGGLVDVSLSSDWDAPKTGTW